MRIPLQETSYEIYEKKYRLKDAKGNFVDMGIEGTYERVAYALASVEQDSGNYYKLFLEALNNGASPAGRILSNAGAQEHKPSTSLINCTVSGIIPDSMEGILTANLKAGLTLKAGCGIGYEFSTLRPSGSFVSGAGATTSGALSFMDIFDSTCFTVSSAGGRRGAQMGTFAVWHPDVYEFIKAKREDGRLRQFNLSLLIDDEFMEAVKKDLDYNLVFPVLPKEKELKLLSNTTKTIWKPLYSAEGYPVFWDINYCIKMGYTLSDDNKSILCKIYNTVSAVELYDTIMRSTYDYAEPGFLLIDSINAYNNNYFCEVIRATNPCLHPDSLIETIHGRVKIKDIKEPTMVYTMLPDGSLGVRKASASWISKKNADTIKISIRSGKSVTCTPDHLIYVEGTGWKEAKNINIGDKLVQLCRSKRGVKYSGVKLSTEENRAYRMEHHMIAEAVWGKLLDNEDVHHINEDTYDNSIDNLEVLPHSEHSSVTRGMCNNNHQLKDSLGKWTTTKSLYTKSVVPMPNILSSNMKNSYSACVSSIEIGDTTDVYDLTVEDTHNFIADFIVVHNCGEQPLAPDGACLLGSINLALFVDNAFTSQASFDWEKFKKTISVFSRMLDNVVELNSLPLQEQRDELELKRRHGMGFLGLGSALTLLGMTYGSSDSLLFAEEIQKVMAIEGLEEGIRLAIEKGKTPLLQNDTNLKSWVNSKFLQRIWEVRPDLKEKALLHGCRYTHWTSIAPTGTIALTINNNVSNGIEPSYSHKYIRNVIREGMNSKEAVTVYSYEMLVYKHLTGSDDIPSVFSTCDNVTYKSHVDIQSVVQKWCDSSISKTINVPTDTKFEDFKDIYMYAYDKGLKGCTTFRFNPETLQGVLVREEDLASISYIFYLEDGSNIIAKGNEQVEYNGELAQANNLYDAIKEGYYGKF